MASKSWSQALAVFQSRLPPFEVPTSFAGLLVYDVLCLSAARHMLVSVAEESVGAVPFKEVYGRASTEQSLGLLHFSV